MIHAEFKPLGIGDHNLVVDQWARDKKIIYLVNAAIPDNQALRIDSQRRTSDQSHYELKFHHSGHDTSATYTALNENQRERLSDVGFRQFFKLGIRHITEGTDHILFLVTLMMSAPLAAFGGRWVRVRSPRQTFANVLKMVTLFSLGHSLSLALSVCEILRAPSSLVEVCVAASVFICAIHTIRPIFPGCEGWIVLFFGTIHGLAFGSTLVDLGIKRAQLTTALIAFNLGIETAQILGVIILVPIIITFGRRRFFVRFRIGTAIFICAIATVWIVDRILDITC